MERDTLCIILFGSLTVCPGIHDDITLRKPTIHVNFAADHKPMAIILSVGRFINWIELNWMEHHDRHGEGPVQYWASSFNVVADGCNFSMKCKKIIIIIIKFGKFSLSSYRVKQQHSYNIVLLAGCHCYHVKNQMFQDKLSLVNKPVCCFSLESGTITF